MSDFHFKSLHHAIEPVVIHYEPTRFRFLSLNFNGANSVTEVIDFVKKQWDNFEPDAPFTYSFPEQFTARIYQFEKKLSLLINGFTFITFILSTGGLIGLVYYILRLKTKEIVIRKVLGAGALSIVELMSKNFMKLTLLAVVLAIPVSAFAVSRWLQSYAYRTQITWWDFAFAGIAAISVALLTVWIQSFKAASANLADSLRRD